MSVTEAINEAVALYGSEAELGKRAGVSQNAIWQAKRKNRVSAELAKRIHWATNGDIPASRLRPDLWVRPEDVPSPAHAEDAA